VASIALLFLLTIASAWPALAQGCRDGRKIIGGSAASREHWPGFAALRLVHQDTFVSVQFCGATAVTDRWLITAAHCFNDLTGLWQNVVSPTDDTSRLRIEAVMGVASLDDAMEDNIYAVDRFVQHETYAAAYKTAIVTDPVRAANTPLLVGHDIAIVRLARSWSGSRLRVPLSAPAIKPDETAIVAGFGATQPSGQDMRPHTRSNGQKYYASSPELLEVTLPLADVSKCRSAYPGTAIGDAQICAGFARPIGKDSCNGDSGGPLVVLDHNLCPAQIGLVSWGASPCAPQTAAYSVYTRISAFSSWLRQKIPELR
jgi:secreted trypsin-like serine protease